jgi:hypothetical protein
MTGKAASASRSRSRRIGWFLPLVATPVIFFSGIFIAGGLAGLGVPEALWRVPQILGSGLAVLSFVVFWVQAVRTLSPGGGRRFTPEEEAEYVAPDPSHPVVTGHRHRIWVLPLLAIPVIILAAVMVIIGLRSVDAPRDAIRAVSVVMVVGIAVALVVLVIGIVRFVRALPAPCTPPAPRTSPKPALYEQLSAADATSRYLSRDEYGVYKGDVGSMITPVNSAGGLLFLAVLLTVLNVILLALVGVGIAQDNGVIPKSPDARGLSPVEWGFLVFELMSVPVAWRYYIVERRAQKLRTARGLPKTLR